MTYRLFSAVFSLALFLLTSSCHLLYQPTDIRLLTEEYAPLNYTRDGKLTGLSTEMVRHLLYRQFKWGKIETMSWQTAYQLVLQGPKTALFSMVLNQERKDLFRWVGPLTGIETRFYAAPDFRLTISSLEDARQVARIAVAKDYYTEQYLRTQGFTNLVLCDSEGAALQLLLSGQADLFPTSNLGIDLLLQQTGSQPESVKPVYDLSIDLVYIAFSPDTPQEEVAEWQQALDSMKNDGTFQQLHRTWLPREEPPGILQLMTEDYPPITFRQDGQITGLATEMVQEVLHRCRIPDNIRMTSWTSGYSMALVNPNVVLFSTERTELRENLFHWVGPIGKNTLSFYAKRGSGLRLNTLEDARSLRAIATTTGWFSEQILKEAGFTNLLSSPQPTTNVQQLMSGDAELSLFTDLTLPEIAKKAGYSIGDLEPVLVIRQTKFYIAVSLGTGPEMLDTWRESLWGIKADGTFARIYQRWVPGADIGDLLGETETGPRF